MSFFFQLARKDTELSLAREYYNDTCTCIYMYACTSIHVHVGVTVEAITLLSCVDEYTCTVPH